MLTQVEIKNFQSLEHVRVTLGKLTVLAGPSNSGKSAFVRALRVLASNPKGDWYRRRDEGEVSVAVTDDEGFRATFYRGKQVMYQLSTAADTYEFSAVGLAVPAEIEQALNVDPELQVTDQFDAPFLISQTPSAAARVLGQLTKADLMMRASKLAGGRSSGAKGKAATLAEVIQRDTDLLESKYGWYATAAHAVKDLYPTRVALEEKASLLSRLVGYAEVVRPLAPLLSRDVAYEVPSITALSVTFDRLAQLRLYLREASDYATQHNTLASQLKELQEQVATAHVDLDTVLAQITACPTCGQDLDAEHREHLHVA